MRIFFHSRILWIALATLLAGTMALAKDAEKTAEGNAPAPLSEEEIRQIDGTLRDFASAILTNQSRRAAQLVAPDARKDASRYIADELNANTYDLLEFETLHDDLVYVLSPGVVELRPVLRYRYTDSADEVVEGAQAYGFRFRRVGGVWYIEQSELIDQFTGLTIDRVATRWILLVFGLIAGVVFTGWMVFDSSLRYHRMDLTLAILLVPVLGPLFYFLIGILPPGRPAIGQKSDWRSRIEV